MSRSDPSTRAWRIGERVRVRGVYTGEVSGHQGGAVVVTLDRQVSEQKVVLANPAELNLITANPTKASGPFRLDQRVYFSGAMRVVTGFMNDGRTVELTTDAAGEGSLQKIYLPVERLVKRPTPPPETP